MRTYNIIDTFYDRETRSVHTDMIRYQWIVLRILKTNYDTYNRYYILLLLHYLYRSFSRIDV